MNPPIKVLVVDDDEVFRQRVCKMLECAMDITIAGEAQDRREALALTSELRPNVVLVDIGISPTENLRIVAQINSSFPDIRIVVLNKDEQGQQARVEPQG